MTGGTANLALEKKPIKDIKDSPYNPRRPMSGAMYDALRRNIEKYGPVEPLVWNKRTGNLVGGHQRLRVLKDLGYEDALCVVVDLDAPAEKLLNLALNKISGKWNSDLLRGVLDDVSDCLGLTGFTEQEVQSLISDVSDSVADAVSGLSDIGIAGGGDGKPSKGFAIYMPFDTKAAAQAWLEEHSFKETFMRGKHFVAVKVAG